MPEPMTPPSDLAADAPGDLTTNATVYDDIVVGGGSAGCIVAAELAQRYGHKVLLLERGDPAERHPETLTADGYKYAFANDRLMFERFTEPQQHVDGRRLFAGTGTGIGGSGSVNGMVYTRGDVHDYAQWPRGWQWNDLLPDFEAMEARLRPKPRPSTEFTEACIAAAKTAGFRRKDNLNDGALCGFLGYEHMSYDGDGRRSSYVAFIKENPPPGLTIRTGALARRILVDDSLRAFGVEYNETNAEGRAAEVPSVAICRGEVVLAAGALETPKLLLLSGIGPAAHLREMGIDVVLDQPAIGENLHDHPNVTMFHKGGRDIDCFFPQLYGFHRANPELPLPAEQADTCYVFYTAPSSLHMATLRMLPAILLPPWLYAIRPVKLAMRAVADLVLRFPLFRRWWMRLYGIVLILGKPMSRGRLRLASRDPAAHARIDPAYFSDPRDLDALIRAVRLARKVAAAPALAQWGNRELGPGKGKTSDAALAKWIKKNVMTTYHYCGTCRMGEEAEAPVDTRLRLRGITGIRIADASAVPVVPVSAMNAPSMLVGFRAARFMGEDAAAADGSARA